MRILAYRGQKGSLEDAGMDALAANHELVFNVSHDRRVIDRSGYLYEVEWVDVDPADSALFDCLERIKSVWEKEFPSESHLGHAAVGMFLFYWMSPEMEPISKLVRENRATDLRAATADFIDGRFGERHGPTLLAVQEA